MLFSLTASMRVRALLVFAAAGVLVAPGVAAAQSSGGGGAQALQNQITEASTEEVQALGVLQSIRDRQAALDAQVSGLQAQLTAAQAKLDPLQADADRITARFNAVEAQRLETQAHLDDAQRALNASAASLLINARAGDGYASIASAAPVDLASGQHYLHRVAHVRKGLVERVRSLRDQLDSERRAIAGTKAQADALARAAQAARDQIAGLVAQLQPAQAQAAQQQAAEQQQVAAIQARKGAFEVQLNELQATSDQIASNLRLSNRSGVVGHCQFRPVGGPIISPFGPRVDPISGARGFHPGDDLQATYGTPIHACRSGQVVIAGWQGGYGNAVVIDHGGGMATLYGHQSRLAVTAGQEVNAGDVIGYVGSTGYSTGPHLHFEVRLGGSPVDPASYIS
jgi:murein DD-endopeptidase MepM/ murein hydrolase activator NlpD